jgi:hypothetical protein
MASTSQDLHRGGSQSRSQARREPLSRARAFLRRNSLSIVLLTFFALALIGQSVAGHRQYNEERQDHGQPPVAYADYVRGGEFLEATMENWESEFLQMFTFVLLTAWLYQKGSPESKPLNESNPSDRDPRKSRDKTYAPWPVRRGGLVLRIYEHSLSLAFLGLFILTFILHAIGGAQAHSEEQLLHGGETVTALEYVRTSRFWFESMQNWQSEFLALVAMVVLAIYLRERGSSESKPVDAPHSHTGHD